VPKKKATSSKPKVTTPAMKSKPKGGVKSTAKPSMPGPGSPTTWYLGGKVHRSDLRQCWRVFVHAGDRCDKVLFSFCFLKRLLIHHKSLLCF
jgi:hypothetical protein